VTLTRARVRACAKAVFIGIVMVSGLAGGFVWLTPEVSAYSPHAPIMIMSDAEFTPVNGVVEGTGTEGDPYVIAGWEILSDTVEGIHIRDTDAYFVIRDVFVHGDLSNYGIYIADSKNGTVHACVLTSNYAGVYLETTSRITVQNSTMTSNYYGIGTYSVSDLAVLNNTMDGNENSIYADYGLVNFICMNNTMDGNEYDAVYVYGDVVNAQIYDCTMRYSGYGWGIYVDGGAESTEIYGCNISSNYYGGIYVYDACEGLDIHGCDLMGNDEQGIYMLYGGDNCSIEYNTIVQNGYEGVYFGSGGYFGNNSIRFNEVSGNEDFGIVCEGLDTLITDNQVIRQTDGGGIHIANDDIRVENNTIVNNAEYGVFVGQRSAMARVANNTFTGCGLFVDFAYSPDVTISDNTVNGLPLLFLNSVSGAAISSGVGQVIALNSINVRISSLDLSNATVGVEFWNTDDSTISGITSRYGVFGVFVKNYSTGVSVQDSDLSRNQYGVWMETGCNGNYIFDCNLNHSQYIGVDVEVCNGVSIVSNQLINCSIGVQSMNAQSTIIRRNNLSWDSLVSVYTVSGSGLNIMENEIFQSQDGIMLYSVTASTVSWNSVTHCVDQALSLFYGGDNEVSNNTLSFSRDGAYIDSSIFEYTMRNLVRDNEIEGNSRYGVFMNYAESNTVCWNNITDNAWGIYISGTHTPRNWIYLNNFENPVNAYSGWSGNNNYWNTSTPVDYWWDGLLYSGYLGNYWHDYAGIDADNNGVGETPYTFVGEQDNYPLMADNTFVIPEYGPMALPLVSLLSAAMVLLLARRLTRRS